MEQLKTLFEEIFHIDLVQAVWSSPRGGEIQKIKIRPVELKGGLYFQFESFTKTQVFHENLTEEMAVSKMCALAQQFKQLQMTAAQEEYTVLISKKGKTTIRRRKRNLTAGQPKQSLADAHAARQPKQSLAEAPATGKPEKSLLGTPAAAGAGATTRNYAHNRVKHYILQEGTAVPFLVDLGVMTREGRIVNAKADKFRQLNRFLEFIEDILPQLAKDRELTILDFGCGKSYLTFAMYYYLHDLRGYDIRIIGLDLKKDVIARCSALAQKYGYEKLTFLTGDIADYDGVSEVDMVVTLHACDTATDHALAKAVGWNAKVILSVPCCQHELNRQIQNEMLSPILDYGLLKERFAALLTDGLRAKYLESMGYETQVLEFIDMEHTPKNILLRAVKSRKMNTVRVRKCQEEIRMCEECFGVNPTLKGLL